MNSEIFILAGDAGGTKTELELFKFAEGELNSVFNRSYSSRLLIHGLKKVCIASLAAPIIPGLLFFKSRCLLYRCTGTGFKRSLKSYKPSMAH